MKRIWTLVLVLCLLLLLPIVTMAQVTVTPDRDTLQVGETLDFTVETDNPDAQTVTYLLKSGDKKVYSGKPVKVWRSAFRPRQEGTYTLQVTVQGKKKKDKETAECTFTVSGDAGPEEEWTEGLTVYSQKDGSWDKKPYRKSTLEEAGCAIFTLSHALQLLGHTGEDIQPANLAKTYAYCLVQGGTNNEKLITTAGGDYGFLSQPETIKETDRISALLKDGCLFSFSVANGHIALVAGLSEDGTKVRIVDSAPTATIERIKKTSMYLADGQGGWTEIKDLADVPGSHWYFETKGYNGMEYWMDLSYVAKRGVRLIRPLWLFEGAGDASAGGTPVKLVTPGYTTFMVEKNGEKTRINTSNLWWPHDTEKLSVACVTSKKTIWIKSDDGAKLKKAESCQLLPVVRAEDQKVWVRTGDEIGWLPDNQVEVLEVPQETPETATVSLKGNTSGRATVKARFSGSDKARVVKQIKTGTEVRILEEKGDYCRVEADDFLLWIHKDYLTRENAEAAGAAE